VLGNMTILTWMTPGLRFGQVTILKGSMSGEVTIALLKGFMSGEVTLYGGAAVHGDGTGAGGRGAARAGAGAGRGRGEEGSAGVK